MTKKPWPRGQPLPAFNSSAEEAAFWQEHDFDTPCPGDVWESVPRTTEPKQERARDPWWTWRWDRADAENCTLPFERITRWRRGSLLTVYRHESPHHTEWWLYGPFNLAVGFSIPKKGHTR
jgi:hypothetical protein